MTNLGKQKNDQQATYQICVQGRLGERWLSWFEDLAISVEIGSDGRPITTLTGAVQDQAGLRGILNKLWDLNLALLSVTRLN
ncbi:MAG TPA: hypothetical protein VLY63_05430 [Anaerolineae bacterium]|nr:hypothetical protein [Anaerolineae bacterium]